MQTYDTWYCQYLKCPFRAILKYIKVILHRDERYENKIYIYLFLCYLYKWILISSIFLLIFNIFLIFVLNEKDVLVQRYQMLYYIQFKRDGEERRRTRMTIGERVRCVCVREQEERVREYEEWQRKIENDKRKERNEKKCGEKRSRVV